MDGSRLTDSAVHRRNQSIFPLKHHNLQVFDILQVEENYGSDNWFSNPHTCDNCKLEKPSVKNVFDDVTQL